MEMEGFDELITASREGDTERLYTIIKRKPDILRRIDEEMFVHTPLHEAASTGQKRFTKEMMNLMPAFATKLNKEGLSPMHLALQNGHFQLVLCLLNAQPYLVRVKGKNGMTTMHLAAVEGYYNLAANFLVACPSCIEDVNVDGETAVHIAVRERKLEVVEVIVGWLRRVYLKGAWTWNAIIQERTDEQGRTALDIAFSTNQMMAVMLLDEIKAKNSMGQSAVDFLHEQTTLGRSTIVRMLHSTRGLGPSSDGKLILSSYLMSKISFNEKLAVIILRWRTGISDSLRDALLVVAVLVFQTSSQTTVNPPGGFRQHEDVSANGTSINSTVRNDSSGHGHGKPASASEGVGRVVMGSLPFQLYAGCNTVVLCASVLIIHLLLAEAPWIYLPFFPVLLMSYVASIIIVAPNNTIALTFEMSLLFLTFSLMLMVEFYRRGIRKVWRTSYGLAGLDVKVESS